MLPIVITQETFNGLSEDLKKHYMPGVKDKDGRFDLTGRFILDAQASDGFTCEYTAGLRSAYATVHENEKALKKQLKEFEGLDIVKARAALETVRKLEEGELDDVGQAALDAQIKQVNEKHQKELEKHQKELEKANQDTQRFKNSAIQNTKGRAISEALKKYGGEEYLTDRIEKMVKADFDENENVVLRVLDKNGTPRITMKSGSQDPMTVDELVVELKGTTEYASAFKGSGASGGGSPVGGNRPSGLIGNTVKSSDKATIEANIDDVATGKIKIVN